ncbi:MAG: hypothetical protein GWP50_04505 [Proteobacteria bacterium]|nr:hypothetical protein [Pseudomonadota bacterium]
MTAHKKVEDLIPFSVHRDVNEAGVQHAELSPGGSAAEKAVPRKPLQRRLDIAKKRYRHFDS